MLYTFQKILQKQLYDYIVESKSKLINLYGDRGSGKTKVAISISDLLIENWKIYYINGVESDNPPYSTWYIANKMQVFNDKINFNIGINFQPFPITFEIGYESKENKEIFFNQNERCIIDNMIYNAEGVENILIIADDIELWDKPSKELLKKINLISNRIQNKEFFILLISEKNLNFKTSKEISMIEPNDNDYLDLIKSRFPYIVDIKDIRKIAGNNLKLAFMIAKYNIEKKSRDYFDILDYRIHELEKNTQLKSSHLESLSIIKGFFSKKETSYLLECPSYESEEILKIAKDNLFIEGSKQYFFYNDKIKNYFVQKLENKEKYLHIKFANYLKENYPEEYYHRFYHLVKGYEALDEKALIEGIQLLLVEYVRRNSKTGNQSDDYGFLEKYDKYTVYLPKINQEELIDIKTNFINAHINFNKYDYNETIKNISAINLAYLFPALKVEILRMNLTCYVQIAINKKKILELAYQLSEIILDNDFKEDEQACKSILVLLDVFLDRHEDKTLANKLKLQFMTLINKHLNSSDYLILNHAYNRKASLYFPPELAIKQIDKSIKFYKNNFLYIDHYMSLVNKSANQIINNQINDSLETINETIQLINDKKSLYFPSEYKLFNNQYLAKFLDLESKYNKGEIKFENFLCQTDKIYNDFLKLLENQKDEKSYVVILNLLSLSLLLLKDNFFEILTNLEEELKDTDSFYKFYFLNLKFTYTILNQDFNEANLILNNISLLDVPLLEPFEPIIKQRIKIQRKLIREEFTGDIYEYCNFFNENMVKVQDNSCYFYLRGLLFSDLQFLSL